MLKRIAFAILTALIIVITLLDACTNSPGISVLSKEDSLKLTMARGSYLVNSVVHCTFCHSQLDGKKFSYPVIPGTAGGGGIALHEFDTAFPGKLYIPNITPAKLKDWTDQQIALAITKGISKNGDTLLPIMPYHDFNKMAKEDVEAVITYIRTLKPIETNYPKRQLFIPVAMFGGLPLPDHDYTSNTKPDSSDKIKTGAYLTSIAGCQGCHTPDPTKQFAGGGNYIAMSANLTPDSATGIGLWTEEMFVAKFRNISSPANINRDAGKYNTLMGWTFFGTMTDNDLKSIYAYLRTVPPIHHAVVKWPE